MSEPACRVTVGADAVTPHDVATATASRRVADPKEAWNQRVVGKGLDRRQNHAYQ